MKNHTITIAGKELPLGFDVYAWVEEIEPKFGSLTLMTERLGSQDRPIGAGVDMLTTVINAGYRLAGQKDKVTREWVLKNTKPREISALIREGKAAIYASFEQEMHEDDGPVDEVLAELEKKEPGSA